MTRTVALLLALTLAACGSASSAGPKTTNPPLKETKKAPDPAEKPAFEVDGLTVKINVLGFKITLPSEAWQGKPLPQDDGSLQILFILPDVPVMVFLRPVTTDQFDLKGIAEAVHKDTLGSLPAGATGALAQEPNGRWSFTVEVAKDDGTKIKGYIGVQELGSGLKRYVISTVITPADAYDANIGPVLTALDSIALL